MTKENDISKMETISFDEAYLKQVLFGSPIYVNSEEVAELIQKHLDGLAEDIKVVKKENAELLERLKQIEELFRYALFSDSDGHYKPCKNTTKQEAYNILGKIQEILGTNKFNGIYGKKPENIK